MIVTNITLGLIADKIIESMNNDFHDLANEVHEAIISSTYLSFDPDTELEYADSCIAVLFEITRRKIKALECK